MEDMSTKRVVYTVEGMDRVTARRNLVYKTADTGPLLMDLYRPSGMAAGSRLPVVVFMPGGPLGPLMTPKDWGLFQSYGELIAGSGLAAVTFNHRFHGAGRVLDTVTDLSDLLAHLRREAADLGLDRERVALWAFSGGGFLLAPTIRDAPPGIRARVAYYAALDLQVPAPGADATLSAETRRDLSPVAQLDTGGATKPPILVARAGRDHPWMNGSIDRFVQEALARNVSLTLLTHPNGQHGFDILDDEARSREIVRTTIAFLKERLN